MLPLNPHLNYKAITSYFSILQYTTSKNILVFQLLQLCTFCKAIITLSKSIPVASWLIWSFDFFFLHVSSMSFKSLGSPYLTKLFSCSLNLGCWKCGPEGVTTPSTNWIMRLPVSNSELAVSCGGEGMWSRSCDAGDISSQTGATGMGTTGSLPPCLWSNKEAFWEDAGTGRSTATGTCKFSELLGLWLEQLLVKTDSIPSAGRWISANVLWQQWGSHTRLETETHLLILKSDCNYSVQPQYSNQAYCPWNMSVFKNK